MRQLRQLRWGFGVLLGLILGQLPAWAYIPPSSFILKTMVSKRGQFKGVYVRSRVKSLRAEGTAEFTQVSFYDPQYHVLKSRAYAADGKELYSVERQYAAPEAVAAVPTPAPTSEKFALAPLLMERRLDEIIRTLKAIDVPVRSDLDLLPMKDEEERRNSEVMSLARHRGQVAWVIGQKNWTPGQRYEPQVWIEKDTFLPLRLIYSTDEGMVEAVLESPRAIGGFAYPSAITVAKVDRVRPAQSESGQAKGVQSQSILREELIDWNLNGDPADLRGGVQGGFTSVGQEADESLQELVRHYYQWVK